MSGEMTGLAQFAGRAHKVMMGVVDGWVDGRAG